VTSPRRDCPKSYRVTLAEAVTEDALRALEQGVLLKGENTPTRPATVTRHSDRDIELVISEGRYHQVKRMLAAVGNHVLALHRSSIGQIILDDDLAPGEFRHLSENEIRSIAE
jgi:16S rRNA pseudouridine516 synthase